MKSLSFTENHPIPTFTLSKVTHGHGKTIKRSQRHLAVTKPRDQTKQNQPSRFVLLSAWQMNPLANDSKQQSSPGKCVHWQTTGLDGRYESQHHKQKQTKRKENNNKTTTDRPLRHKFFFKQRRCFILTIQTSWPFKEHVQTWMLRPPLLVAPCLPGCDADK